MSQRSQLYHLFCEGLHRRSAGVLSSTVLTSTPLEEDDGDDAGFVVEPPPAPSPTPAQAQIIDKENSPGSSVQGQMGSAATDSPLDEGGVRSTLAPVTKPQQALASTSTQVKSPKERRSHSLSLQTPVPHAKSNQQTKILVGNVSPPDFIDKLIAVKRRDEALCIGQKHSAPLSSSSSETDFEGAEEYFKKCATSTTGSPLKANEEKSSNQRTTRSSKGTSDGSNINLVLESISSSSSDSENFDSQHSPSAARCRIFTKPKPLASQGEGSKSSGTQSDNTRCVYTSSVMKGVTAYVEVRSGSDNRSMGVKAQMRILGATVKEKFDKQVTHVVFNEGSPSLLNRAKIQGCFLVSVLWIDACKREGKLVSEKDYPPLNLHLYDENERCKRTKYRKMKSIQPDFEEGKSDERLNKYVKKFQRQARQALASQRSRSSSPETSENNDLNSQVTGQSSVVPVQKLKTLRVVLRRIDDVQTTNNSSLSSEKRNKRKLMPLRQEIPMSLSLEDIDTAEQHTRPDFPYGPPSKKSKPASCPRRIVKQKPSVSLRRRSSCFVRPSQSSVRSQCPKKQTKSPMRTMVCTFMHRRDIDVVAAVIKQLGGWILEPTVSKKTSHVVCGDSKRTINLLRGIANGCWIVHQEWVMRSLEAGYWLDEEPFELNVFPAIQQNRKARETLGVQSDIFKTAGAIFVAKNTTPPRSDLLDLLELCGGNIVKTARQAKIIIGQYNRRASSTHVSLVNETWILDCIQENMLLPLRCYRL